MPRILHVDSNPEDLKKYSEALRRKGYDVDEAGCGEDALRIFNDKGADCVVLDIAMPGEINGLELLEKILQTEMSVPIVLHTASKKYGNNYIVWACDAYVPKEKPSELVLAVANVLTSHNRE